MTYKVTLIPGDGTGPELVEATRRVLEATGVAFQWEIQNAGVGVMEKEGTPLALADLEIAAITIANELTLVSGNTRHFARIEGLKLENWLD